MTAPSGVLSRLPGDTHDNRGTMGMPDSDKPNIVCVVAHPDDMAHSMGGTAVLLSATHRLHVLCLTRGDRGIKGTAPEEAAAIRTAEEEAAAELVGGTVTFLDQSDGQVFAGEELCTKVAGVLSELKPRALFTLWPLNVADHFMAYAIAVKALHVSGLFYETEVYMSENGIGGQTNSFDPDLYVDITTVVARKRALVACHHSQHPTDEGIDAVLERNRIRGMMARCEYAEPFKTVMPLANMRWGRKAGSILLDIGPEAVQEAGGAP